MGIKCFSFALSILFSVSFKYYAAFLVQSKIIFNMLILPFIVLLHDLFWIIIFQRTLFKIQKPLFSVILQYNEAYLQHNIFLKSMDIIIICIFNSLRMSSCNWIKYSLIKLSKLSYSLQVITLSFRMHLNSKRIWIPGLTALVWCEINLHYTYLTSF